LLLSQQLIIAVGQIDIALEVSPNHYAKGECGTELKELRDSIRSVTDKLEKLEHEWGYDKEPTPEEEAAFRALMEKHDRKGNEAP